MIPARPLSDPNAEPMWLMPGSMAALLAPWAQIIAERYRREGLVMPADLQAAFFHLRGAAEAHVAWRQAREVVASTSLPTVASAVSYSEHSSWWSTRTTATYLGVTPRTVSDACTKGLLRAVRAGEGRGVAWSIDPDSAAEYKTARDARAQRAA